METIYRNMVRQTNDRKDVKTTNTAFDILETIKECNGARISELASELGLANSTVHRHVNTLYKREWLVKRGDEYQVSFQFLEFGEHARIQTKGHQKAKEKVVELADKTDERAQFLIEEHGWIIYVYRELGSSAVSTDPGIGNRAPLHATSAGKVILANLPDNQVNEIIEQRGLPKLTEQTITDQETLFEELETIRDQGYSVNREEKIKGVCAVGTPVMRQNGDVLGAISVSAPTNRMKGEWFEEDLPDLLLGTANELELNIAYSQR